MLNRVIFIFIHYFEMFLFYIYIYSLQTWTFCPAVFLVISQLKNISGNLAYQATYRPSNLRDLSIKSSLHLHCRQSRSVGRMNLKMLLSGKTGDTEVEHWRTFIFSISSSGCSCGSARRSRGWVQSARLLLLSQIWWLCYPGGNLQGGLWLWL